MRKLIPSLLLLSILFVCDSNIYAQRFRPLFNGKNLKGWDSYLKTKGKNQDPDTVFSVHDKQLRIGGKEFGYLVTQKTFDDFHLVVETHEKHPHDQKNRQ